MINERALDKLKEMNNKIMQSEGIPEDVKRIVRNMFERLSNKYDEMNCNNSTILDYLETAMTQFRHELDKIGEKRKDTIVEEFNYMTKNITNDLENELDEDTQNRRDNMYKERISELGESHNRRNANIIMDRVQEALMDIQSRQKGVLVARGYDDRRIDNINEEVRTFIRHMVNINEENIYEIMKADTRQLNNILLDKYEEFLQEREGNRVNDETSFKDRLKDGRTLEQQRDDTEKIIEKMQETQEDNGLKKLPDIFL